MFCLIVTCAVNLCNVSFFINEYRILFTYRAAFYVIVAFGDSDMDEWIARIDLISSIVIPIVFSIVFILGLIGNGTLIYTILANKWMRTKSNVLIVSLAGGDFLLILVFVPFAILLYTTDGWWFGQLTCKVCKLFKSNQIKFNAKGPVDH